MNHEIHAVDCFIGGGFIGQIALDELYRGEQVP
jgi:hypothetical protein